MITFEYGGVSFEVSKETYNKFLAYEKANDRVDKAYDLSNEDFKWSEIRYEIDLAWSEYDKAYEALVA